MLAAECYDCHGPEKSKAGLRLDHRDLILKGGDSGAALVKGKPDESAETEADEETATDETAAVATEVVETEAATETAQTPEASGESEATENAAGDEEKKDG